MKNKIFRVLGVTALVVAIFAGIAVMADDGDISLSRGQEIPTDYINAGDTVDIASDVRGDVIVAGSNVDFSGSAGGDILIAAVDARIRGSSAGDIRVASGNVTLDGTVAKNVTIVGGSVIIEEGSVISGNLYVAAGSVELRGEVKGNASIYCSDLVFSGSVGGDASFSSSKIVFREDATIAGNLTYASSADLSAPQGVVSGTVARVPMESPTDGYTVDSGTAAGFAIWQFLALLVVVLILGRFFAKQLRELAAPITKKEVWIRIASGFIWLVVNPIVIAVAIITIIGLPLALILLFFYVVLIIIAFALTPLLLGALVNQRVRLYEGGDKDIWKDFILGYVVMQIISLVPFLGGLFIFFLFLFAFGRVMKYSLEVIKRNG